MKLLKTTPVIALLAVALPAMAEEFPPFFPEGGADQTPVAPQPAPANQPGPATQNQTAPQASIDQRIIGKWEARNETDFAVFGFYPNGMFTLELPNGTFQNYYATNGQRLLSFKDAQHTMLISDSAYQIDGDFLTITTKDNESARFKKVMTAQQPAPQPGQSWPQQPAPQPGQSWPQQPAPQPGQSWPQQPTQLPPPPASINLQGVYYCFAESVPDLKDVKFKYEFTGNTYFVSVISMGKTYTIEVGQYQMNGPYFNYYVTGSSVKPEAIGTTGSTYITPTANGFVIQSKEGYIMKCGR